MVRPVRSDIPEPLAGRALHRRDLAKQGITDARLRSQSVRHPFRGVHADAGVEPGVRRRIDDVVPLLPTDGVIGGWAAAYLHGARDLDGRRDGQELDVLVCVPRSRRMRGRPGLRVLRSDLLGEVDVVDGIPVTSAPRTAVDLARLSGEARRGVVAIDALWACGATSGPEVLGLLETLPGLNGAGVAREAALLAEPGVRSLPETQLRMLWIFDAGLPRPLVNRGVVDLDGHYLGAPDLLDEASGSAAEYDGRGHREISVATVDHVRQEGLERNGLIVSRFTALDVRPEFRVRTVWRLQDGRRRGLLVPERRWRVVR